MPPAQPPNRQARRRTDAIGWVAVLLSALLVVVACGDGDGDSEAAASATEEIQAAASDAATVADEAEEDGENADGANDDATTPGDDVADVLEDLASDAGSATVTIGDQSYAFSLAGTLTVDGTTYVAQCREIFGMIAGSGFAADGRDITVDMEIPPIDWETYEDDRYDPPAVEVEVADENAKWVADVELGLAGSSVGEYVQDGSTASGSATFVNEWDPDAEPIEGTFAIDCEA